MIAIIGGAGSGKTTMLDQLIKNNPDYKKVITYTTRPKRESEQEGVDYHFIDKEEFQSLLELGFFAEFAEFRGWRYGTAKKDCESPKSIIVISPSGYRLLKEKGYEIVSIYLFVDRRTRLLSTLLRGDDINEAYRRNIRDEQDFEKFHEEANYVIDNTGFQMTEEQVLLCMQEILEEIKG